MCRFVLGLCWEQHKNTMVIYDHSHMETCWASFSLLDVFETLPAGGEEPLRETIAG